MNPEEITAEIKKLRDLYKTSHFTEAIESAYQLLEHHILPKDTRSLINTYNLLGHAFWRLSDFPKAIKNFSEALQISEENGEKYDIAMNLSNIGVMYKDLSDYPKAIDYYSKALQINEEIGNKSSIATVLGNIGSIYVDLLDYTKALEYLSKSLQMSEEIGDKESIAINLGNIGLVYKNLFDHTKALEYLSQGLQIIEEIGNKVSMAIKIGNIGGIYKDVRNYSKALEYYSKALQIYEEIGNKIGISHILANIGEIHTTKESEFYDGMYAEEILQKALGLAREIGAKIVFQKVYELLHTLRYNERKFEEALEFYKKSIEIEKEIQSDEATNKAQQFDQRRIIEEDEKARQLKLARFQEQEKILLNILPVNIADRILKQEMFIADHFDSVSVLFMDLVGFTTLSAIAPPKQLVYLLDAIFHKADDVVETFGLEKIKTIGDGYLAVANVTTPLEHHQKATAMAALKLLETMKNFSVDIPDELGATDWIKDMNDIQIRVGIHTGEVVAGIIGKNKFTYDLWGDAVNVASRMESNSESGRIHISEEFAKSIESNTEFHLIPRGEISIKGKGTMKTFWLEKAR